MDNVAVLVYGQNDGEPTSQHPGFSVQFAQPMTARVEYIRSIDDADRTKGSYLNNENYNAPSSRTSDVAGRRRNACQAPFDMDSLKAAIQAARPDSREIRRAILSCTFKPRERAFTRLINMCGRQKESRKALEVFETMKECRGVRPNTYTYSALISACSNAGDWGLAIDVFTRMKEVASSDPGCRPNQITYHAIIAASERGGRYDVCLSCFREMVDSNASPDAVAYCSAINACQRMANWKEAERILSDMHSHELVASAAVYACMIEHCAKTADWKSALDLFLTMQVLGQAVDEQCCGALMMALEAGQQPDTAHQLIQAMEANNINIHAPVFVSALKTMAISGMRKEAVEVTHAVKRHGLRIHPADLSQLTLAAEKAGQNEVMSCVISMLGEVGSDSC